MADEAMKYPDNVPGPFYVDDQCIDCDLCRDAAPANFTRNDGDGHSYVFKQPENDEEVNLCKEALEGCPVEAIGIAEDDGGPETMRAASYSERKFTCPKCSKVMVLTLQEYGEKKYSCPYCHASGSVSASISPSPAPDESRIFRDKDGRAYRYDRVYLDESPPPVAIQSSLSEQAEPERLITGAPRPDSDESASSNQEDAADGDAEDSEYSDDPADTADAADAGDEDSGRRARPPSYFSSSSAIDADESHQLGSDPLEDRQNEPSSSRISINVASPDTIRSWSHGEVKNPETINYRTLKPESRGLFCERIFGPTRDWECSCGKYKRIKHKGVTCDRCGVEVTLARVRRERMGHIELAAPVAHIWYCKCEPSPIGLLLDLSNRQLERVVYYEDYLVIDPGQTPLTKCQLLTETEYREAQDQFGENSFVAGMGADSIKQLLSLVDLNAIQKELGEAITTTRAEIRERLTKRLRVARGFANSHTRPEWMILDALPVIPPDLRPMVPLEYGGFVTSDLNDLYRRVINRTIGSRTFSYSRPRMPSCTMRSAYCRRQWTRSSTMAVTAAPSLVPGSAR